jgi:hypothetical protein
VELFGLASSRANLAELFLERAQAEQAVKDVLTDEPDWADEMAVVRIKFSGTDQKSSIFVGSWVEESRSSAASLAWE